MSCRGCQRVGVRAGLGCGARRARRGFSVIEVLIVVALVVGLASLGGVVLSGWLGPLRDEASVAALERAIAQAADRARREGVPFAVVLPGEEQMPAATVMVVRVEAGAAGAARGRDGSTARESLGDGSRRGGMEEERGAWPIGGELEGRWLRIGDGEDAAGASQRMGRRALVVVGPEGGVLSAAEVVLTRGASRLSVRIDPASGVIEAQAIRAQPIESDAIERAEGGGGGAR